MEYLHQETQNGYTLTVKYEDFADDPTNWGNFTIKEMSSDMLTEYDKILPSIQSKLRAGKAFLIDKFEHSTIVLRLHGEVYDRWDNQQNWGIIEFSSDYVKGVSIEERRKYAAQDLEIYTQWLNGEVYRADIVEDESGEYIDGVGDCYGLEETIAEGQAQLALLAPVHSAATAKNAQDLHK